MGRDAPVWIFDLDNTLHDANPHIFPHINRSMTAYVARHLRLDPEQASALREHYWHRYGATLLGLMRHHGTDPHHFLRHTHQFDDLPAMVVPEPGLRAILRKLPGRKIVFSNAPRHYAQAVLRAMGVAHCFERVFAIEHMRFVPKPGLAGLLRLVRAARLAPARCIMVEDSAANLRPAKRLGMRTVWIARRAALPPYVDLRLESVAQLPRSLQRL